MLQAVGQYANRNVADDAESLGQNPLGITNAAGVLIILPVEVVAASVLLVRRQQKMLGLLLSSTPYWRE